MDGKKNPRKVHLSVCFWVVFCCCFQGSYSDFYGASTPKNKASSSSVIFPLIGNVYPDGYYHATLSIGQPPKPYFLDIDTGSDITWLQCDAPCTKCMPAPHRPYKPNRNLVTCKDPLCLSLQPANYQCEPQDQCDYEIEYADSGSSMGVLVHDAFSLKFTNGSISAPRLAFGCGYHQEVTDANHMPYTDGVLGLGTGKSSILSQLRESGLRNIVGHCLSAQGGGFLSLGDDLVPPSRLDWLPLSSNGAEKHYTLGPADLLVGGRATGIKGLSVIFDSGSTYSYLNSQAYGALISLLKKDLKGQKLQDAVEEKSLPVCWKGPKPFRSIIDVKGFFKPLELVFKTAKKNIAYQMQPEAYLIVTKHGNVCLGILNGAEVGLGEVNILGDISLLDKLVIYDYEKWQIGWVSANCNRLPNEGYRQAYANIFVETCPAAFLGLKRKKASIQK